jgi:hypothetical protein
MQNRGVLLTANGSFPEVDTDNFRTLNVPNGSPLEVLQKHRDVLREFIERGSSPYSAFTQETRIQATHQFYASRENRIATLKSSIPVLVLILVFIVYGIKTLLR